MINYIGHDDALQSSMLSDSVARFCEGQGGLEWSRQYLSASAETLRRLWPQICEQGWLGLRVAEEDGGLGLGIDELAALHEQWGKVAGPVPLAAFNSLGVGAVARSQNRALREQHLPGLIDGSQIAALVWQSNGAAMAADDVRLECLQQGDGGYILTGSAVLVLGAGMADAFVVAAQASEGMCLFWIPANTPGVRKQLCQAVDYSEVAGVSFDDVQVDAGALLADGEDAATILNSILDEARIVVSAELVGLSKAALETTLVYLSDRKQFGRAIGSNQALQHRAVDLYIKVNLAQAALLRALRVAADPDASDNDIAIAAVASKSRCSNTALSVVQEAIQMHGGIGYTEECNVSLYVRRALTLAGWLGDARSCRARHYRLTAAGENHAHTN